MDSKEVKKVKADALLAMGHTSKDVSEKLNLPYHTIQSWKRRLDKKEAGAKDLDVVVDVDLPTLHMIAENIKENAPQVVVDKIDKLVDGVTSLQTLDGKFHAVVLSMLEKAEIMSKDDDLSIKDWALLATSIGSLYNSIFNKAGINVNVNNQTNIHSEKLSMFKSTMRNS